MPIYEYQCPACGHKLEAFQKISEEPLRVCPACQQPQLQKLISAAGFQLKGSGWYLSDYSAKGAKKEKEAGAESASGTSTTSTTTTPPPTKPDTSSTSGTTKD